MRFGEGRRLRPLFKPPICTVCKKSITKERDLKWEFRDEKGNPIHYHCANYLSRKKAGDTLKT